MTISESAERIPASLRTEALEQLLTERGLVDPKVLDTIITTYETNVGPLNGAKVIAKAWSDPHYRRWLLDDGTAAIRQLGYIGVQTEHVVVVENTATSHHVVVCTLCSCYPWQLLGLPPSWYKDPAYRARIVREPRKVLSEMGLELPAPQHKRIEHPPDSPGSTDKCRGRCRFRCAANFGAAEDAQDDPSATPWRKRHDPPVGPATGARDGLLARLCPPRVAHPVAEVTPG